MKLKDLLLERKTKLSEAKKLADNRVIKSLIIDLYSTPGAAVLEKLQDAIDINNVDLDGMSELFDNIQAAYKKVDNQVAKMIETAIADYDYAMMEEKNKKLEAIKGHVNTIQSKLQKEVKKAKKKK